MTVERFLAPHRALPADEPEWLRGLRFQAATKFRQIGFPLRKGNEEWKFTNLDALKKQDFYSPQAGDDQADSTTCPRLILRNGRIDASGLDASRSNGLEVLTLNEALASKSELLRRAWGAFVDVEHNPFALLNTASFSDALVLIAPRNATGIKLEILHQTATADEAMSHPRLLVIAEESSQIEITERFLGGQAACFCNPVSEFIVATNARVRHYRVIEHGLAGYHLSVTRAYLQRDSRFDSHQFNLEGRLIRNDVRVLLNGENAECLLNGVSLVRGQGHVDNYTEIHHRRPHCNSFQTYKSVLGDSSTSAFSGRIVVDQIAQKTDAKQSNQTLLLSNNAKVNSKPQLEIFADDVKCTHGATVGQLDDDGLFYLRARGLSAEQSKRILTVAFVGQLLDELPDKRLSAELFERFHQWRPLEV